MLGDAAFLRKKADDEDLITPLDDRGWLLRLAVDCDRPDILKLLPDLGLDPDARVRVEHDDLPTSSWGMPLYQCAGYGKYEMAVILLERGADAVERDAEQWATPPAWAEKKGHVHIAAMLRREGVSNGGWLRAPSVDAFASGMLGQASAELS